ncbi:DUF3761 domain-containing protein [Granulicella arctica]|nr:DUF3761 domain-containing protein [Granulicella arctica]
MKLWLAAAAAAAFAPILLVAQAPAGSTGQCKDGSYTTAASKSGACRGHKGIQTWYATTGASAPATTPAATTKPAPVPASAPQPTTKPAAVAASAPQPAKPTPTPASSGSSKVAAAGGGPGLVWVNTSSKVYHCQGTANYGTTKQGKYMSEADAKAMGAHADHGKPCSQ